MSIPPLVCCTPPPPDQCEDDKDPEDFDISYNLSQDDDDDDGGYNFGNCSSYNFQSSADIKKANVPSHNVEISKSCDVEDPMEIKTIERNDELQTKASIKKNGKIIYEEDINIEDLELEMDEEIIDTSIKVENDVMNSFGHESSNSDLNLSNEITLDHLRTLSPSPATDDNSVESLSIEEKKHQSSEEKLESSNLQIDVITTSHDEPIQNSETLNEPKDNTISLNDDFEDFDDFQFASTENQPSPIDTCVNPWDSNTTENDDFGNFTANFENINNSNNVQSDPVTEIIQIDAKNDNDFQNDTIDDDDDFGDFDDFKSSAIDKDAKDLQEDNLSIEQGPGINFQLSDNEGQLMESIINVLSSVFEEEITEPETEFEGKLETMLSETWRHLRETDVRQPYIINWNNSLGQKTLLRALCIDSRNILFGPKWGYNMPKYAVNLSNAPLQPQKPLTPSSSTQSEAVCSEKNTIKPGGWVDPFTSDGQESCSIESESVVEVTSSDLDVFEAAISTKPDKIYSSTLNVQPLRQINLPDTHIFTPTDSETPRSKTIHYSAPPIVLPESVLESPQQVENFPTQNTETSDVKNDDEDDDWEFQDFKSSSAGATSAVVSQHNVPPLGPNPENITKPNATYQTQVLKPIKMEPLMPSLNWPDPGEVKETFEDFSDFISKTSWDNEQTHITSPESGKSTESDTFEKLGGKLEGTEIEQRNVTQSQAKTYENFDDEFDTFQSALPPKDSIGDFTFKSLTNKSFNNIPNIGPSQSPTVAKDFDYTFPKTSSNKSETISFDNTRPVEALTQSLGYPTLELTSNKIIPPPENTISGNLLQPLPINSNSTQKHQKTAQILQPLSLESYSQINWPNPGIDLQDLSRFNPVETLQSLKSELNSTPGAGGTSKGASPVHVQKNTVNNPVPDDDIWGEFVSSKPKQQTLPKIPPVFVDDDEWTDFVSSPSVKPQNGLNTISLNVHTNSNIQKSNNNNKFVSKNSKVPLDIPTLNYITPKSSGHNAYNERHFQNL